MDLDSLYSVITSVRKMLDANNEWVDRYAAYAEKIQQNSDKIIQFKKQFKEWKPLYLYMAVGHAKDKPYAFRLKYQGQEVAELNAHSRYSSPLLRTTDQLESNKKFFGASISLKDADWRSQEASKFRKFFSERPMKVVAKSHEHTLESIFLTEIEKRTAKDKDDKLCGIRPVKFADIARFQLCTPLKASKPRQIGYSGVSGGGIDVLARVGIGSSVRLCVMELKDNYEFPQQSMEQALAYAVFLQELLASKSGDDWLKIFGFSGNGDKLREIIKVCVVMPIGENAPCQSMRIKTERGVIELHYIYLNADWRERAASEGEKKSLVVEKSTLIQNSCLKNTIKKNI